MRKQKITIYLLDYVDGRERQIREWRWHWKAANGKVIAASTEGYVRRKRAIENLAYLTGGRLSNAARWALFVSATLGACAGVLLAVFG